jgi:solute carrier family 25 (mitochondrial phosphate transporter), member 23/24/25/41
MATLNFYPLFMALNCPKEWFADRVIEALGYFLAGAFAGIASRTATAPLDRLKVYLIAQTSDKKAVVDAMKDGSHVKAVKHFGRPLVDAMKDLWAAGGLRSLFAGEY